MEACPWKNVQTKLKRKCENRGKTQHKKAGTQRDQTDRNTWTAWKTRRTGNQIQITVRRRFTTTKA